MRINFEHYGQHTYDPETKTLYWARDCGVFSNVMVMMHGLMELRLKNIVPEKIHTQLLEYTDFNLYDNVLTVNQEYIEKWRNFDIGQVNSMRHGVGMNLHGFGTSQKQINLDLTKTLVNAYFNFSTEVLNNTETLKQKHNITTDDSAFIWWRKTDKVHEITWSKSTARYPEVSDALKYLKPHKHVYMQTDDSGVYHEFLKYENISCLDIFNRNKYFIGDNVFEKGFHREHVNVFDDEFKSKYGISRREYIINLISLVDIASQANQFIGYPGNITLFVCLVRNSFENVTFFKNHEELF